MPNIHEKTVAGLTFKTIEGDPDAPSIVLLHGYGANENDLISLSQVATGIKKRPTFYFPRAPLEVFFGAGYTGRSWFPINIDHLQNNPEDITSAFPEFSSARNLCETWLEELNISPSKLFIGGFSQGAVLATDIALNAKTNIGGLLVFSGTLVNKQTWQKLATQHPELPFFQSHGKKDPILPFHGAQSLLKLFLDNKFKGELHAFDGGHEIPHSVLLKLHTFFLNNF